MSVLKNKRNQSQLDSFIRPFGYPMDNTDMKRVKTPKNSVPYTGKSLGLGSEVSQVTAVSYPNPLDHYIKQTLGVRWYARYMDDGYMIFKTKEDARIALDAVIKYAEALGMKYWPKFVLPSTSKIVLIVASLLCVEILFFCQYMILMTGDTNALYAMVGTIATLASVVLGYFMKSTKENTKNGITYETAMASIGLPPVSESTEAVG